MQNQAWPGVVRWCHCAAVVSDPAVIQSVNSLITLFALIFLLAVLLSAVGAFVLGCLIGVGLLMIQIREDEVEDIAIPIRWSPFNPLFDVL